MVSTVYREVAEPAEEVPLERVLGARAVPKGAGQEVLNCTRDFPFFALQGQSNLLSWHCMEALELIKAGEY